MNGINEFPLVEIAVRTESILEGKLAACLLLYPKETVSLCNGLKFRVNIDAIKLWEKANSMREEILDSDDEYLITANLWIMLNISPWVIRKWLAKIIEEDPLAEQIINPVDRIIRLMSDLEATRGTSIWLDYVQKNGLLTEYALRGAA